jgi:hypothetical protein
LWGNIKLWRSPKFSNTVYQNIAREIFLVPMQAVYTAMAKYLKVMVLGWIAQTLGGLIYAPVC